MKTTFLLLSILTKLCFLSSEFKWLEWWPVRFTAQGVLKDCSIESGKAYVCGFDFEQSIPFTHYLPKDSDNNKTESNLKLKSRFYEWTKAHQMHDEIRTTGSGLFSHWDTYVLLSTPNNEPIETLGLIHFNSPLRLKYPIQIILSITLLLCIILLVKMHISPLLSGYRQIRSKLIRGAQKSF